MAGVTAPAGRADEVALVGDLVGRAVAGEAWTVLVAGEPGIGKTTLVGHCCDAARDLALVLTGACLPMRATTVPLLALRAALRGAPGAAEALAAADGDGQVLLRLDAWLDRTCAERPVVLCVDDLQWADQATLDALLYLAAGPAARPFALVATLRVEEGELGSTVRRWLADVRRLPRVERVELGPLDRQGTADQLADLLGAVPHQSLVDDVRGRASGNPYLTRLLVAGLTADARRLPEGVPVDLRSAVLQSWSGLPDGTRAAARVLAVASMPLTAGELATVLDERDGAVREALTEGVDAGVLAVRPDGRHWFAHPLGAEVLERDLADDERSAWHRRLAALIEDRRIGAGRPEALVALADHLDRAGDVPAAREAALRAAAAGGTPEADRVRLLVRAVELDGPRVGTADGAPEGAATRREVLERLRQVAAGAGDLTREIETVDALLAEVGADDEPAVVAELLVRRMHLELSTGRAFFRLDGARRAAELAAGGPAGEADPVYALALAELAHAELWHGDPAGPAHAARALVAARASGDPRALAFAATAESMAEQLTGDPADSGGVLAAGADLAAEGIAAADRSGDPWAAVHATFWHANARYAWYERQYAGLIGERRAVMTAAGVPHTYLAWLAASEASSWVVVGAVDQALAAVRVALGSDPGPVADVSARLAAARLATWQGRQGEARAHLARAEELCADLPDFLQLEVGAVRAEVLLGDGEAAGAYGAAMAAADADGVPPTMCEWLVPLAARALADLAERERDGLPSEPGVGERLDDLVARFPGAIRDVGAIPGISEQVTDALSELYRAEVTRAREPFGDADAWLQASGALGAVGLAWEEAYALWRAARAALSRGRGAESHRAGVRALREGAARAESLGAAPVLAALHDLARQARVELAAPGSVAPAGAPAGPGGQRLTSREADVLARIVVGRTYGEIAAELVISEKTVSTHVSHLLAKTGTSSRVALSDYARRTGLAS